MTGGGSIEQAVEAIRLGARTYLQKPFSSETLLRHLAEIEQVRGLRQGISGRGGLVGSSAGMRRAYQAIDVAAASDLPVLVRGETGTGKELAAQAIHRLSRRCPRPFVALNCAAIPKDLAESELFGHEAGSFTGAQTRRDGRFQLAEGGTLFLDEINSLAVDLQPKLLRALETGEVWPVGASRAVPVDVRIVAAANSDLRGLVGQGRFREDLFYRLAVLEVVMPPLRERAEDVPAIATLVLERDPQLGNRTSLSADAMAVLISHRWQGNVRELVNTVRRAAAIASVTQQDRAQILIGPEHLDLGQPVESLPFKEAQDRAAEEWTRRTVLAALSRSSGSVAEAAKLLQMDRTALYKIIRRLGITVEPEPPT
jgi:DNA-binding NtrC family response regulator